MRRYTFRKFVMQALWIPCIAAAPGAAAQTKPAPPADPTTPNFSCLDKLKNAEQWAGVESAMADELSAPPRKPASSDSEYDETYPVRSVRQVCAAGNAAIVVVEYRPRNPEPQLAKWDRDFEAFNLDLRTSEHRKIDTTHATMLWKLVKVAQFEPGVPDIVFTSRGCTECEGGEAISSYRFDPSTGSWTMRKFGNGKDPWWDDGEGIVVAVPIIGEDETISFDCAYGVGRYSAGAIDELFVRCEEVDGEGNGGVKISDVSIAYKWNGKTFGRRRVTESSEIAQLMHDACDSNIRDRLCRLPFWFTDPAGIEIANANRKSMPSERKTARTLAPYRRIRVGMTFEQVEEMVGAPDREEGSGMTFFLYYLEDGTVVTVYGANNVISVSATDNFGKATTIVSSAN